MHIHLDPVGGISGNMFVGALLECFPQLIEDLPEQLVLAGFADLVELNVELKNDGVLTGTYFEVTEKNPDKSDHAHRHYSDIKSTLENSELEPAVIKHALGIFQCLAEAEARVHNKEVMQVAFHEVGAWDSIADIVCAAYLIDACGARSWSVASLPLGSGFVETAHGRLPVPAPATVLLLEGFSFHDDELTGERVTPTGAAILHYLKAERARPTQGLALLHSGNGFGSKKFPGISNILRTLVFEVHNESRTSHDLPWEEEKILELAFEVDDQNGEDLAVALDHIRAIEGVLDINQYTMIGKKQRMINSIRVLLEIDVADEVIAECFNQTSTLGIRKELINRVLLPRLEKTINFEGEQYRVKFAQRPDGELTAKVEMDDLARDLLSRNERELLRQEIEALVFEELVHEQESNDNTHH